MAQQKQFVQVLVIYTGGTIGMIPNENGELVPPELNEFADQIRKYPSFHDVNYPIKGMLTLPPVKDESSRIRYEILEYSPLLDSSNMDMKDWTRIADDIYNSYQRFDGFVVLHGTDTMCYTASALSFMFENLGKTVIVTGAQIPIFETRTDGKDNFISALIIAGRNTIPEVCILFNNRLFRGNRTVKESNNSMNAFHSPNAATLAKMGVDIKIDDRSIFRSKDGEPFKLFDKLDANVDLIYMHPFISTDTVKQLLKSKHGVVLLTYGAGNIATDNKDLMEALETAVAKDHVLIVNCTQCHEGTVSGLYATGKALEKIGVISGLDMTLEAALVKLSYVLAQNWTKEKKMKMIKISLRGELTEEISGVTN